MRREGEKRRRKKRKMGSVLAVKGVQIGVRIAKVGGEGGGRRGSA